MQSSQDSSTDEVWEETGLHIAITNLEPIVTRERGMLQPAAVAHARMTDRHDGTLGFCKV